MSFIYGCSNDLKQGKSSFTITLKHWKENKFIYLLEIKVDVYNI